MRKYGTRPDVERYAVRYSATSQTTTCILLRCIHDQSGYVGRYIQHALGTAKVRSGVRCRRIIIVASFLGGGGGG